MTAIFLSILLNLLSADLLQPQACITHEIQKGDTLASISKSYYGNTQSVWQIYSQNSLRGTNLIPGSLLQIYIPTEDTWKQACSEAILARYRYHSVSLTLKDAIDIANGVELGLNSIS
jgi:hypothetical protein